MKLQIIYSILFLSLGIIFLLLGFFLDESYVLKFSPDKHLTDSTKERLGNLKTFFNISGLALLFIFSLSVSDYGFNFFDKYEDGIMNVSILLVIVICAFMCLEIFLRLTMKESDASGASPINVKFNQKVIFNSEGFRDNEFEEGGIAALGDSFTFGAGIENPEDRYTEILEKNINLPVNNFGYESADTFDEVEILKNNALKYNPKVIIIGYVFNDYKDFEQIKSSYIRIPVIGFWLRDISFAYYFFETKINNLAVKLGILNSFKDYSINLYASEINQKENLKAFDELRIIADENNLSVYILIFPLMVEFEDYPFIKLHNQVNNICSIYNFTCLDLLNEYKNYSEEELIVSKSDIHPSIFAHKLAAEMLEKEIK